MRVASWRPARVTQSAVSPPQRTSPVFVADLLYPCDWHRKTWAPRPKYSTLLQFSVPCQFQLQKDATLSFCRMTNSTASLSFQPSSSVSPVQAQYPPRPPRLPFLNSLALAHHAITPIVAVDFVIVVITTRNEFGCNRFSSHEADRVASSPLPRGHAR